MLVKIIQYSPLIELFYFVAITKRSKRATLFAISGETALNEHGADLSTTDRKIERYLPVEQLRILSVLPSCWRTDSELSDYPDIR
jgi:hypothetical protein